MSSYDSINKVMLLGNLGADPELKHTKSGTALCNIRIATSWYNKRDDREDTQWHRVVLFGKDAENASKFLFKGSKVFLEGRLQTRSYDDRDGNRRYITEIVGNRIVFLDSKGSSGGGGGYSSGDGERTYQQPSQKDEGSQQQNSGSADSYSVGGDDDDLPF